MKKNIVFLCGLLCDKTVWNDVAKELEDIYDIAIISFAGCDSIEMMAKKVLDNSPKEFILIGHSMGGRVALEVYNQEANRVLALGLFNTGVHPKTETEVPGRLKLIDLAQTKGIPSVCKQWLPPMVGKTAFEDKRLMNTLEEMVNKYSIENFSKQINALLNRPDARTILPKISVPTLLLSASEDNWSPISQHAQMQEFLKDSTLVEIQDAGHFVPIEKAKEVANEIASWLENKI